MEAQTTESSEGVELHNPPSGPSPDILPETIPVENVLVDEVQSESMNSRCLSVLGANLTSLGPNTIKASNASSSGIRKSTLEESFENMDDTANSIPNNSGVVLAIPLPANRLHHSNGMYQCDYPNLSFDPELTDDSPDQRNESDEVNDFNESDDSVQRSCGSQNEEPIEEDCEIINEEERRRRKKVLWNDSFQGILPSYSCVIGMFAICRISLLVVLYGGPFVLQFSLLSALLGVPFLFLMVTMGQYLGSGIVEMWYICPAFQGVGIAFQLSYAIFALYTVTPLSWMFAYLRDSSLTAKEMYRWANCTSDTLLQNCLQVVNTTQANLLAWTIPSYFRDVSYDECPKSMELTDFSFYQTFNQGLLWFLVFVCTCRGVRLYGKIVSGLTIVAMFLFFCLTCRFLNQWPAGLLDLFLFPWKEHLADPWTWTLAAREVFLTWVLLGGVILQISSHNRVDGSLMCFIPILVIKISFSMLLIVCFAACLGKGLKVHGASMIPTALDLDDDTRLVSLLYSQPMYEYHEKFTLLTNLVGDNFIDESSVSSYQAVRLATELFPALAVLEGPLHMSQLWSLIFYFVLVSLGFAQLISIWMGVVDSVIGISPKHLTRWITLIDCVMCIFAFVITLPFASNVGLYLVHFFDFSCGALWWLISLFVIMLSAVLMIRGSPYSSRDLLETLYQKPKSSIRWFSAMRSVWSIFLPCAFLGMTALTLNNLSLMTMTAWPFWPSWLLQLSQVVQLSPLLIVVFALCVQIIRYFAFNRNFSFNKKFQGLCCPTYPLTTVSIITSEHRSNNRNFEVVQVDPPPNYSPPPSYSKAASVRTKAIQRRSFGDVEVYALSNRRLGIPVTWSTASHLTINSANASVVTLGPCSFGEPCVFDNLGSHLSGYSIGPLDNFVASQEATSVDDTQVHPLEDFYIDGIFEVEVYDDQSPVSKYTETEFLNQVPASYEQDNDVENAEVDEDDVGIDMDSLSDFPVKDLVFWNQKIKGTSK